MGFFSVLGDLGKTLAAPVLGAVTGAVNANQNRKENERNRAWQEKMSDIAYQRQRDLTMESPMLQKQGLQMAGISPAAMNGYTGGTAQVSTGTPAPVSLPESFNFDPSSLLQSLQVQNQTKVADADVKLKESEAALNYKQAGRYDELTDATISKMRSDISLNDSTIKKVAAEVPLLNSQREFVEWQSSQAMLDYQKSEATYQSDIDRIKATNKCSQREAELRYDRAKDIVEAQLALLRAQTYNARASGQAQLSNAYTNRLQYNLDKANSTYINAYYNEAAGKLHSESVSEETFRHDRLRLLDNDATLRGLQGQMMGLDLSNYNLDHTIDDASKLIGAATGAVGSVTNVRNSNTNRMNAESNRMNAHTNVYNAETRRMRRSRRN